MNGTAVARHGLILGEDEAAASGKRFKDLRGPPGSVSTICQKHPKSTKIRKRERLVGVVEGGLTSTSRKITGSERGRGGADPHYQILQEFS